MKQLGFSDLEESPAPANIKHPQNQVWYNRYGGYIVETRWNSQKRVYDTIYHQYDYPDTGLMAND